MSLTKLVINHFKSYEHGEIIDLSGGVNLLIGKNGSGKSNLISALEFVLTDRFLRLNTHQKEFLFCRSPNHQKHVEASVEVTLTNTDQRFPISSETIVIRRQLTRLKDQFTLNGNPISTDYLFNFLETGGFSSRNVYFIVRYSDIESIVMSDPKTLLDIVRAICGAKSFEERKELSFKQLSESQEVIQGMQNRIDSLQLQVELLGIRQEDVANYHRLNKVFRYLTGKNAHFTMPGIEEDFRRCKEVFLASQTEFFKTAGEFKKIQLDYDRCVAERDWLNGQCELVKSRYESNNEQLNVLNDSLIKLQSDHSKQKCFAKHAGQDLNIATLQESLVNEKEKLSQLEAQLTGLKASSDEVYRRLRILDHKKSDLVEYKKILAMSSHEATQFIREKLKFFENRAQVMRQNETKIKTQLDVLTSRLETIQNWLQKKSKMPTRDELKTLKRSVTDGSLELNRITRKIRMALVENEKLEENIAKFPDTSGKLEEKLAFRSGHHAVAGRKAMIKLMEIVYSAMQSGNFKDDAQKARFEMIADGYHGQLVDSLNLNKEVYTAIDALLKNSIFYHVVKDENVLHEILDELNENQLKGHFEFIILNRLRNIEATEQFHDAGESVRPLLECFNLHSMLDPMKRALKSICHHRYLVRDFNALEKYSQNSKGTLGTLTGETIDKWGIVTFSGSDQPTRLQMFKTWVEDTAGLEEMKKSSEKCKQEIKNLKKEFDEKIKKQHEREEQLKIVEDVLGSNSSFFEPTKRQIEQFQEQCAELSKSLKDSALARSFKDVQISFWTEVSTAGVSAQQAQELEAEVTNRDDVEREFYRIYNQVGYQEIEKEKIEKKIENLDEVIFQQKNREMENVLKNEMVHTTATEIDEIAEKIRAIEETIEKHNSEFKAKSEKIQDLESEASRLASEKSRASIELESKKRELEMNEKLFKDVEEKKIQRNAEIESSGFNQNFAPSIPQQYVDATQSEVKLMLRDVKRDLEQFSTKKINQETLRQVEELHANIEKFSESRQAHEIAVAGIGNIIRCIVDKRRDILVRSFRQLNQYFQVIFRHFVPNGRAMIMLNEKSNQNSQESSQSNSPMNSDSGTLGRRSMYSTQTNEIANRLRLLDEDDNFSTMDIRVSFTADEQVLPMQALSGGQKTVVAIAFVFALQKIDPMPFHVYDELDQALDPMYRTSLASLLQKMSTTNKKQFLISSHFQQLCNVADNIYGVVNHNSLSEVIPITSEQAIEFIEKL